MMMMMMKKKKMMMMMIIIRIIIRIRIITINNNKQPLHSFGWIEISPVLTPFQSTTHSRSCIIIIIHNYMHTQQF